ncbi:MAG: hypothetical protein WCO57_15965 [Verrucomicrobiota bacterium]
MNTPGTPPTSARGASLIEALLALGVLAVALPLVAAVMAHSAQSMAAAQAESRCTSIIPACIQEIDAAHEGKAQFLPRLTRGQPFPASGETLALAFSDDGRALGSVTPEAYLTGTRALADEAVRYLASIRCEAAAPGTRAMRSLCLTLEYPSAAPATRRKKLDFHTRIP